MRSCNPRRTLLALNDKLRNVAFCTLAELQQHLQERYLDVREVIQTIKSYIELGMIPSESILMLGKTGWGKSTTINLLHGLIRFTVTEEGNLLPENPTLVITQISDGSNGSTTMAPKVCQTTFGTVCDLPGDEDTGGAVCQMINSICKKNVGKNLKRIKLVLVVPENVLGPEGAYGRDLKTIFQANDRFFKGINKYKNSILLIISFSNRRSSVQRIVQKLRACLAHQDGALLPYREILQSIIQNQRIKLIPKPSPQDQIYNIPNTPQWQAHTRQKIIECLKSIPMKSCSEDDFLVPQNINLAAQLKKLRKVVISKIKFKIEQNFGTVILSGIELNRGRAALQKLKVRQTLKNFIEILKNESFLQDKVPMINEQVQQLIFINQFCLENNLSQQNLENQFWLSNSLQQKINKIIEQIIRLSEKKGGKFRIRFQDQQLIVRPNSQLFDLVQQGINQLKSLYLHRIGLQLDRKNNQSQFYQEYAQHVFDRTQQRVHTLNEKYVENQERRKTVQEAKTVQYDIPIQKQRVTIVKQTETYSESVPKVRTITKTKNTTITTRGDRKYLLFGPRQKIDHDVAIQYETSQIYYETQQKTREVEKPRIENYTENIKGQRVEYEEKEIIEMVPIQKEREVEIKYNQNIFREEMLKRFKQENYEQQLVQNERKIQDKTQFLRETIMSEIRQNNLQHMESDQDIIDQEVEKNYQQVLIGWKKLQYGALERKFRGENHE